MAALGMVDERLDPVRMPVTSLLDLLAARRRGQEMALALGFPVLVAIQVATAIFDFCRHVCCYHGGGVLTLVAQVNGRKGIQIVAQDQGLGTANIEVEGASRRPVPPMFTREVFEAGRLMDEFEITFAVDGGMTIRAARWLT